MNFPYFTENKKEKVKNSTTLPLYLDFSRDSCSDFYISLMMDTAIAV